jgi:hypothetical protein
LRSRRPFARREAAFTAIEWKRILALLYWRVLTAVDATGNGVATHD